MNIQAAHIGRRRFKKMARALKVKNPYFDGRAGGKIVNILAKIDLVKLKR